MKLELARRAGGHLLPPNTNTAISADTGEDENMTRTFSGCVRKNQAFHMTGQIFISDSQLQDEYDRTSQGLPWPRVEP